jgi:microcystin-dependent protein
MPLESASFISQLNPSWPLLSDTVESTQAHLTLIKSVLQGSFPNLGAAAVIGTAAALNIASAAFNGAVLTIPNTGTTAGQLVITAPASGNTVTLSTGTTVTTTNGTTTIPGVGFQLISQAPADSGVTPAPVTELASDGEGNLTATTSLTAPAVTSRTYTQTFGSGTTETTVTGGIVPSGGIIMWAGAATAIPAGWYLCDGTNNTPDLQDQFIVGAGKTYAAGATGGVASVTLTVANLPTHTHTLTDPGHTHTIADPGHNHGVVDPGHAHGVYDPGHSHSYQDQVAPGAGNTQNYPGAPSTSQTSTAYTGIGIEASTTGVHLNAAATGITNSSATTGITLGSTGSGTAFGNLPPYFALCFIMKA